MKIFIIQEGDRGHIYAAFQSHSEAERYIRKATEEISKLNINSLLPAYHGPKFRIFETEYHLESNK